MFLLYEYLSSIFTLLITFFEKQQNQINYTFYNLDYRLTQDSPQGLFTIGRGSPNFFFFWFYKNKTVCLSSLFPLIVWFRPLHPAWSTYTYTVQLSPKLTQVPPPPPPALKTAPLENVVYRTAPPGTFCLHLNNLVRIPTYKTKFLLHFHHPSLAPFIGTFPI